MAQNSVLIFVEGTEPADRVIDQNAQEPDHRWMSMVGVEDYPPIRWAVHLLSCGIHMELIECTLPSPGIPKDAGTALVAYCDLLLSCQHLTLVDKSKRKPPMLKEGRVSPEKAPRNARKMPMQK